MRWVEDGWSNIHLSSPTISSQNKVFCVFFFIAHIIPSILSSFHSYILYYSITFSSFRTIRRSNSKYFLQNNLHCIWHFIQFKSIQFKSIQLKSIYKWSTKTSSNLSHHLHPWSWTCLRIHSYHFGNLG